MDAAQAAAAIREAMAAARQGLVDREVLVELIALGLVAGEHLLVIGPPGTAKSEAVRRVGRVLGGRYFEYLLGRFTEPSELFGPIDLRRLREGVVETETRGMLPEAEIAFLDEVFRGSTAILNTLLGLLHERVFRRGHTTVQCPLRLCVGAANELPRDESLAAFADRFLLQVHLDPVADPRLEDLLEQGASLTPPPPGIASLQAIEVLAGQARRLDLISIRSELAHAIRLLRRAGILLSDRRVVSVQRLCAAAAVLDGRDRPAAADLWPLLYAVPGREPQLRAREVLRELLDRSRNELLSHAAEEASASPAARADRLARTARGLLARSAGEGREREHWGLRLEAVAREIDASFAREALPPELAAVRAEIVARLPPA